MTVVLRRRNATSSSVDGFARVLETLDQDHSRTNTEQTCLTIAVALTLLPHATYQLDMKRKCYEIV